jgi:hypothetical protein
MVWTVKDCRVMLGGKVSVPADGGVIAVGDAEPKVVAYSP